MKTTVEHKLPQPPLQVLHAKTSTPSHLRVAHRQPPDNFRLSVIKNKFVQDPANWDVAWFASYE